MSSGPDTLTFPPHPTPFGFGYTNEEEKMELSKSPNVESVCDEIEDDIEDFTPREVRRPPCTEIQVLDEQEEVIWHVLAEHLSPVIDVVTLPMNDDSSSPPVQESVHTQDGNPTAEDTNETRKDVVEKSSNSLDKKGLDQETLSYTNNQEAKNAFKALLEYANVASDWTWDQAMRAIINDRRYGAIKSLGERKQVFNEFIVQKKRQDAEERWTKQKKAREEFRKMLEECKELTSSSVKLRFVFLAKCSSVKHKRCSEVEKGSIVNIFSRYHNFQSCYQFQYPSTPIC